MAQDAEDALDLARVAGDADPGAVVVAEDVVEHDLAALGLRRRGLGERAVPQLVVLGEAVLELEPREHGFDVRLGGAPVAGVDADALAEELLDRRHELVGQVQAVEGEVCRRRAAVQRAGVERARRRHLLGCELALPEGVGLGRLRDSVGGEVRVRPGDSTVAILLGPVAVPSRGPVVGLSGVVVTLSVPGQVQDLVLDLGAGLLVQSVDVVLKALPLRLRALGIIFRIRRVRTVKESVVRRGLHSR